MGRRRVVMTIAGVACGGALLAPASAAADGGPAADYLMPRFTSAAGTGGPRVVVKAHGKSTDIKLIASDSTRLLTLAGRFAIPAIAFDESATGMSADGNTLVLHRIASASSQSLANGQIRRQSRFVMLSTDPLRVMRRFTLPANFAVDAVSPDGSRIYFVHYNARNPTRYSVRAYDVAKGSLEPQPIVDPSEHEGEMRGIPQTRVYSPDGRWAYTLYEGGEEGAFVHALDTARGRAHCIDLPDMKGNPYGGASMHIASAGAELRIARGQGRLIAIVDTATLEARRPAVAPETTDATSAYAGPRPSSSGVDWTVAALPLGLLVALGSVWLAFRRRSRPARG